MRRRKFLALGCAALFVAGGRAHGAEPAQAAPTTNDPVLLPAGTVFQPPDASELDFGRNPPEPRRAVEKDTRVVAVIFSVNQIKAMRKAFRDQENLDILPVAGRPMIEHVIAGLKSSRYVDRIIVVADPAVREALALDADPMVTFLEDQGDAAENVKRGIHTIARGDLVILVPSDLLLVSGENLDPLVEHARAYDDIDVFFPLIQQERCKDTIAREQRFIRFKEGRFTGAHVELVRPALFVDNAEDVEGERGTMYQVYNMRRNTLGIVRFLGLRLTLKFIINDLSPADVATRIYTRYHVRAQAFLTDDARLAADLHAPELLPQFEAVLAGDGKHSVATAALPAAADPT